MKRHGLMPHHDRFPLLSRDWEDIDCFAAVCEYNVAGSAVCRAW